MLDQDGIQGHQADQAPDPAEGPKRVAPVQIGSRGDGSRVGFMPCRIRWGAPLRNPELVAQVMERRPERGNARAEQRTDGTGYPEARPDQEGAARDLADRVDQSHGGEKRVAGLSLGETAKQWLEQSETDERGKWPETGVVAELQESAEPRHGCERAEERDCSGDCDAAPYPGEDLAPGVGFVAANRQRGCPGNDGLDRAPRQRSDPEEGQQGHQIRVRGRRKEPCHADRIGNPENVCDHAAGKGDGRARKQLAHDGVVGSWRAQFIVHCNSARTIECLCWVNRALVLVDRSHEVGWSKLPSGGRP